MKRIITAVISGGLFAGLIVMLGRYNVAPIGPQGTTVGFSMLNQDVHDLTGVNMKWYDCTEWLGYAALLICALFAFAGLVQLVRRKSLLKVDKAIYALAVLYIAVIGIYVFFEKHIVNYRPIIMPGATAPEASFPSSHTMLIITVMVSTAMVIGRYVKNKALAGLVAILCYAVVIVTVFGRLVCGVHWVTDIIGGVLISITLLSLFSFVLQQIRKGEFKKQNPAEFSAVIANETPASSPAVSAASGDEDNSGISSQESVRVSRTERNEGKYRPKH